MMDAALGCSPALDRSLVARSLTLDREHRFYGESRPTADMSVESLVYLTSEQALADLARFITYVNAFNPAAGPDADSSPPLALGASTARSKWVSFGGSYPGNLATWLKLKCVRVLSVVSLLSSFSFVHWLCFARARASALLLLVGLVLLRCFSLVRASRSLVWSCFARARASALHWRWVLPPPPFARRGARAPSPPGARATNHQRRRKKACVRVSSHAPRARARRAS